MSPAGNLSFFRTHQTPPFCLSSDFARPLRRRPHLRRRPLPRPHYLQSRHLHLHRPLRRVKSFDLHLPHRKGAVRSFISRDQSNLCLTRPLLPQVWIVWTPRLPPTAGHRQPSRWSSPMYRLCMLGISPFIVIIFLMIFGRIAIIRHDNACVIGLKEYA